MCYKGHGEHAMSADTLRKTQDLNDNSDMRRQWCSAPAFPVCVAQIPSMLALM